MTLQPEMSSRVSPEATHFVRPLDVFHHALNNIVTGRNKKVELVTIQNDLEGKQSTMSNLVKQLNGQDRICFTDMQIHDDLITFFQELTGEQEPIQLLWDLRHAKEAVRDSSHSHFDIVTMRLDAVCAGNVQVGVSVVTDESKDWAWTYFIAQTPKPKLKLSQLFRRSVHDQTTSSRM